MAWKWIQKDFSSSTTARTLQQLIGPIWRRQKHLLTETIELWDGRLCNKSLSWLRTQQHWTQNFNISWSMSLFKQQFSFKMHQKRRSAVTGSMKRAEFCRHSPVSLHAAAFSSNACLFSFTWGFRPHPNNTWTGCNGTAPELSALKAPASPLVKSNLSLKQMPKSKIK